jgi:hypothetical protein
MTQATKRPAAQVECAQKAAELKISNAEPNHDDAWSSFPMRRRHRLRSPLKKPRDFQGSPERRFGSTFPLDCFDPRRLAAAA